MLLTIHQISVTQKHQVEDEVAAKDSQLDDLRSLLAHKDSVIARQESELNDLRGVIAQKDSELNGLHGVFSRWWGGKA